MTTEEAIKTLKENCCAMCAYGSQYMDSCDIRGCDNRDAIKALKREPCEDCVSRQAVLDIVNNPLNIRLDEIIKKLPPVTPQPKTGHWIDDKCSVCGKGTEDLIDSREWYQSEDPKYCPFCGVKLFDS